MALGHKVNGLEMGETRSPDLAAVGLVCSVRDEIHAKLSFGGFNDRVCLAF